MIRDIAGRQNHSVKLARKLQHKKHRRERGLLVCEGMDLLRSATAAGADIRDVVVRRDLVGELPDELVLKAQGGADSDQETHVGVCDEETLRYASSLGGAADVIFTCVLPKGDLADIALGAGTTFYLDMVGDPGNVGTIARSALAFGLQGVVCSPGTADPFSPKAMRAGMGAQFLLPIVTEVTPDDLLARLSTRKKSGESAPEIWVADPHGGVDVADLAPDSSRLVVLGSERRGPSDEWEEAGRVTVPQGRVESLNVAMAAAVIAYESRRGDPPGVGGN